MNFGVGEESSLRSCPIAGAVSVIVDLRARSLRGDCCFSCWRGGGERSASDGGGDRGVVVVVVAVAFAERGGGGGETAGMGVGGG